MNSLSIYQSHELPANDRIPVWHDVIWRSYVPLNIQLREQQNFQGFVSLSHLGGARVVTSGSLAQRITRTPRLINQDTDALLMFGLQLRGRGIIEQHGRRAVLQPGEFTLWDTRQPYDILFPQDWSMAVFQFPREACAFDEQTIRKTAALELGAQGCLTRAAAAFLASLARDARVGALASSSALLAHTLDMLALCLQERLGQAQGPGAAYDDLLFQRAHSHIRAHLHQPSLSAPGIAQALGVSTRQLQRLFQARGQTVGQAIRHQRLERIKAELTCPTSRRLTVAAIARKWGFQDAPHFNRCFKAQYRIAPTAWQRQHLSPGS